jgi:hypothetical protein
MPSVRLSFLGREVRAGDDGPTDVVGAELGLPIFGEGQTSLEKDNEKALVLKFFGRFLTGALQDPLPDFKEFAKLEVQGKLVGTPPRPKGRFSPTAKIEYAEPPKEDDPRQRTLKLDFHREHFVDIPPADTEPRLLKLPVEEPEEGEPDAAHFELSVAIEVDGKEEAAIEVNDVLDVPLKPLMVGLLVEWPLDLDERAPAGLTLQAKQGKRVRTLRWVDGLALNGARRFLFRGILGPEPVDLLAINNRVEHQLWKAADITNEESPPEWENSLESVLEPAQGGEPEKLALRAESVQKIDRPASPSGSSVDPFEGVS